MMQLLVLTADIIAYTILFLTHENFSECMTFLVFKLIKYAFLFYAKTTLHMLYIFACLLVTALTEICKASGRPPPKAFVAAKYFHLDIDLSINI